MLTTKKHVKYFMLMLSGFFLGASLFLMASAYTIEVDINNAVQYIKKLVVQNTDNSTGIILNIDDAGSANFQGDVQASKFCDKDGNNCKDIGDVLTGYTEIDPKVGTLTQDKRCFASGTEILCTADEPVGGSENLWNTGNNDSINYMSGNVNMSGNINITGNLIITGGKIGIGISNPTKSLEISTSNPDIKLDFATGSTHSASTISFASGGVEKSSIYRNKNNEITTIKNSTTKFTLGKSGTISLGGDPVETNDHRYFFNIRTPSVSATGLSYVKGMDIVMTQTFDIPSGVVDTGYRAGSFVTVLNDDADFEGTLKNLEGQTILYGSYNNSSNGTITNAIGLRLEGYNNGAATITNKYGIYQRGADFKNYFQGNIGIGTEDPQAKLDVNGTVAYSGTYLKLYNGDTITPNYSFITIICSDTVSCTNYIEDGTTDGQILTIISFNQGTTNNFYVIDPNLILNGDYFMDYNDTLQLIRSNKIHNWVELSRG